MQTETDIDHSRGLCGIPDVPLNTPKDVVELHPAHCKCCGSQMRMVEMSDSFAMLGMYELVCPSCPSQLILQREETRDKIIVASAIEFARMHYSEFCEEQNVLNELPTNEELAAIRNTFL